MAIGDFGPDTGGPIAGPMATSMMGQDGQKKDVVPRDAPQPEEARAALVSGWNSRVKQAKTFWDPVFKQMKADQAFCRGHQWSNDPKDTRYVANLTLRLVQQRTSYLYAKNPKAVAKRRPRIENTVWDGTQAQLNQLQAMQAQVQADPTAMQNPAMPQMVQQGMAIATDAAAVKQIDDEVTKVGKTLELLYQYQVDNAALPFKKMMKNVVRRTVTTGVGYIKIGFHRAMGRSPDAESKLVDAASKLATLERLAADLADGEIDENAAEAEQLRVMVADLQNTADFVVHEGLTFDYPASTAIICDPKTTFLPAFVGADWVAEEYMLSPAEIQEIYGVDVGTKYMGYNRADKGFDLDAFVKRSMSGKDGFDDANKSCALVWEIYSRKDGLIYIVCDGYPEFLREPYSPMPQIERFYPWFPLIFNQCDSETEIYPPSDVYLIKDMQLEFNRSRQGLREHRRAARPKTIVAAGALDEEDLNKLENHPNNAVLEIAGLLPGQDVKQLLQPYTGPGIDPNLYETEQIYNDLLRTTGIQEANLGGTSDSTATQAQIAESSRMTSMGSSTDELNDLLTELARAGGQICLLEIRPETVQRIVGKGAVWPELTRQQINDEVWLEVEAGSMGIPNQAQQIANAERIVPLLLQIPGISPEFLARELLRRMDDDLDLSKAFAPMLPSMVAMNSARGPMAPGSGPQPGVPGGPAGAGNAPQPPGQAGSPPPDAVAAGGGPGAPGGPPTMQ